MTSHEAHDASRTDETTEEEMSTTEIHESTRGVTGAIATQRAILNSEFYWHGTLRNSADIHRAAGSYEDPRSSKYLEP
jgi:hypothetical protein